MPLKLATVLLAAVAACAACGEPRSVIDLDAAGDEVRSVLDFTFGGETGAVEFRNECRASCAERFGESELAALRECEEFCDCVYEDQELFPTVGRVLQCVQEWIAKVRARLGQ